MKKLGRLIKILMAGIFYLIIIGAALILATGLTIGIWASEMRIWFKPFMSLLIGFYAVIIFTAAWEGMRIVIGRNLVAKQN